MRFNGARLTKQELSLLEAGDLYFCGKAKAVREFTKFSDDCDNAVVNSKGFMSKLEGMRWATEAEFQKWSAKNKTNFYVVSPDARGGRVGAFNRDVWAGKGTYDGYVRQKETESLPKNNSACNAYNMDSWSNSKKEGNDMSHLSRTGACVNQALTVAKSDLHDAAWRTAAKQTLATARAPLTALLDAQKLPPGVVSFLLSQFETENGEAVLAMLLGTGLTYMPQCSDAKFVRLAKELRVLGMEHFVSKVANTMLKPFRDELMELLKGVPLATPEDK